MGLQIASLVYCLLLAIIFLSLWLYYDRRDHARFEHERRRTTFRCLRCNHLYVVRGQVEEANCPKCGRENNKLKF